MELHVRVVEAKDIEKMDTIGKSDPFVKIKFVGTYQRGVTKIQKNTLTPIWNEEFHFPCHNPNKQVFKLKMLDHDVAADDLMSTLEIPVATLEPGKIKDQWFEMQPFKAGKKGGLIHLVFHLNYFGLPAFKEVPPVTGPGPYVLNLRLVEAKDVPKMDLGKSDPFVKIEFAGNQGATKVVNNTITPKWDETFQYDVKDVKTDVLILRLFDKDVIKDDPISVLELGIGYLPYAFPVDQWFSMENVKGDKKKKGGQLHMIVQVTQKGKAPFQ